jgi:DNA invertase Pin-like site-specific DNA recombinase
MTYMGVGIISLREGLDWTTPSGRLQAQLLAMIAEFERARLRERVLAGLARARRDGKRLGRPPRHVTPRDLASVAALSVRAAARELNVSPSVLQRARHDAASEAQRADISISLQAILSSNSFDIQHGVAADHLACPVGEVDWSQLTSTVKA